MGSDEELSRMLASSKIRRSLKHSLAGLVQRKVMNILEEKIPMSSAAGSLQDLHETPFKTAFSNGKIA